MSFTILYLGTLGGGSASAIQGLPRYHNVTPGAPWVGEVSLLQDDHSFPEMSVQKMHSHRRPHCLPPVGTKLGGCPQPLRGIDPSLVPGTRTQIPVT